jgi:hypothetical protein
LIVCSAAAVVALLSTPAFATNRLIYSRDRGARQCPDEAQLREAVHARLHYDPFSPWGDRTVLAEISGDDGKLRARLTLLDANGVVSGRREVAGGSGDCEELVKALALAISITLDPMPPAENATDANSQPSAKAEPADVAATPLTLVDTPAPSPETPAQDGPLQASAAPSQGRKSRESNSASLGVARSTTRANLLVRAGPVVMLGVTPSPGALGGRAGVGLSYGVLQFLGEMTATTPTSVASELGGVGHVQLTAGSMASCVATSFVAGCGLLVLGRTHSFATDVENATTGNALFSALGARIEATAALERNLGLVFTLEGLKPLSPVRIFLRDERLWSSPALAASLGIAANLQFR